MTQLQSDIWEGKRPYSVSSSGTIGMETASKLRCGAETTFSPGQKDSQVVANSQKLNLRRDLRWVAKRTRKFPLKYTQVAKKPFQQRMHVTFRYLCFYFCTYPIIVYSMLLRQ